ncbi:16S rRNA (guanine(527)-N(7))-methyltransferase RsmG [Actinomarinicola tropica]|uniref:16S rRNA (guanine(527)-N(7))-methyltransferase RsmG n=1 Tax=Actinomarinicola tropica TaxID=2789776 RepID=UPI00189883B2|nr:RsmG family class I SAM-dependent methyltransferase [Actinomarinicola tropica]
MDDDLTNVLERSRTLGFLGPGPVTDHIEHAQRLVAVLDALPLPTAGTGVDLGSGGGVPGLVVARALPTWRWILLDAMERRTAFLDQAVHDLGLRHVEVRRERAELSGRSELRHGVDLVVARSFGPPAVTAECAAPLLRVGGILVVSEPPTSDGARWSADGLRSLGLDPEPLARGTWIAFRQDEKAPESAPRAVGRPGKRPLW